MLLDNLESFSLKSSFIFHILSKRCAYVKPSNCAFSANRFQSVVSHVIMERDGTAIGGADLSEMFARRLRQEREAQGWTQMYMAGLLGITNGTISGYERNYREPDIETLIKIANLLETSVDYLVGKTDCKGEYATISEKLCDHRCPYQTTNDLPKEAVQSIKEFITYIYQKYTKK